MLQYYAIRKMITVKTFPWIRHSSLNNRENDKKIYGWVHLSLGTFMNLVTHIYIKTRLPTRQWHFLPSVPSNRHFLLKWVSHLSQRHECLFLMQGKHTLLHITMWVAISTEHLTGLYFQRHGHTAYSNTLKLWLEPQLHRTGLESKCILEQHVVFCL
jgi:hypothetical protein